MENRSTVLKSEKHIKISFYCHDARLRYPTGVKIVDSESKTGSKRIGAIMNAIDEYSREFTLLGKQISKDELTAYLDTKFNPEKLKKAKMKAAAASARSLVDDHKKMINMMRSGQLVKKSNKGKYSDITISQYERMRERWEECAADPKSEFELSYEMTIDHFRNMINWLIIKKYSQNSMYNIVNNLGIFLRYALDKGYHTNRVFEHEEFSIPQEDSDAIAPLYDEILKFYRTSLKIKSDERARDLFVFGCFLAVRVEDLSSINEYKLSGNHFEVLTRKTGKRVVIPCHPIAREIYNKHNGVMPVYIRQTFARILNRICKESNAFPGTKLITITIGGKKKGIHYKRHEFITPHTMRRFFATWMYRDLRRQPREIMAITGHETEESFFKYIKIELEMNAEDIFNDPAFQKIV
ncbi:tyrosine-type recombinase/integrase [Chitinophaga sancti]|nr:hypothetical protein [Chitinophaga sancti]WQD62663.1 hypothetical protein U0033_32735 [Chitinophaga sancti]WQG91713.1 hypothetical protein SR876_09370 [Chitinophaga sancti]